jgi:anthranilate/para-aminobenzoate synthase component II
VTIIRAHIRVSPDGTLTGSAPGAAPGEHDAAIILSPAPRSPAQQAEAIAAIRAIQQAVARLPVLDSRPADEIIGYDEHGLFG